MTIAIPEWVTSILGYSPSMIAVFTLIYLAKRYRVAEMFPQRAFGFVLMGISLVMLGFPAVATVGQFIGQDVLRYSIDTCIFSSVFGLVLAGTGFYVVENWKADPAADLSPQDDAPRRTS